MSQLLYLTTASFFLLTGSIVTAAISNSPSEVLKGKKICIDPGHGDTAATDSFRQGVTGEREEWIDLRVAIMLKEMLEKSGAEVIITRLKDEDISLRSSRGYRNRKEVGYFHFNSS